MNLPTNWIQKLDQIEKTIESTLGRRQVPGMMVGIAHKGEPIYLRGFGLADIEQETPVTPDTVFRIASISKVITAISILQLCDAGLIALDDPVNEHLTSTQLRICSSRAHQPVTIRHLLTHTGGIGEFAPLINYLRLRAPFGVGLKGVNLLALRNFYRRALCSEVEPGTQWNYANHGFALLGQLVEDKTGQPFPAYVKEKIFEPLGMNHSDFLRTDAVSNRLATGYWDLFGKKRPVPDFEIITLADGSLFTSGQDFMTFLTRFATDGAGLLAPRTYDMMFRPYFQKDRRLPAMGLGVFMESAQKFDGCKVASHDGLWLGFHSSMYFLPHEGCGVFAFANQGGSGAILVAHHILRQLLSDYPSLFPTISPHRPDVWDELYGTYRPNGSWNLNFRVITGRGNPYVVYKEGDQLMLKTKFGPGKHSWKHGIPLKAADPEDPLAFVTGSGIPIIFYREPDGSIGGFYMRYRDFRKK